MQQSSDMINLGITTCFRCGSDDIITDYSEGDVICRGCGEIVGDRLIDETADWRQVSTDASFDCEARSRASKSKLDNWAPTTLGSISGNGPAKKLRSGIKKAHGAVSYSNSEINLVSGLCKMAEFCRKINLTSNIVEKAHELYQNCHFLKNSNSNEEISHITSRKLKDLHTLPKSKEDMVVISSVIYVSCRLEGYPRTLSEVAKVTGVDKAAIGRASKLIVSNLELENLIGLVTPQHLINRIGSQLQLPFQTLTDCNSCCKHSAALGLLDGTQPSIAAGGVILLIESWNMKPKPIAKEFLDKLAAATHGSIAPLYKVYTSLNDSSILNQILPLHLVDKSKSDDLTEIKERSVADATTGNDCELQLLCESKRKEDAGVTKSSEFKDGQNYNLTV